MKNIGKMLTCINDVCKIIRIFLNSLIIALVMVAIMI